QWYHAEMAYTASNQTLVTTLTNFEQTAGVAILAPMSGTFTDLRVDTISVSSYTDAGDSFDSLLAHGVLDNLVVTVPDPPVTSLIGAMTNGVWQVLFASRAGWLYTLERTDDFHSWMKVSAATPGAEGDR